MKDSYVVIKCGGSTLAALPPAFYDELTTLQAQDITPVLVHGGGPAISETLERFNIPTQFINGLRRTTDEVLDIVEMVLSGQMNKQIVRIVQQHGGKAVGLSGVDGQLIVAQPVANAEQVGFVGDVVDINTQLLQHIMSAGYMPVIAPIGIDAKGQRYNINADTAAGAIASHLGVKRLVVITDVPGIMRDTAQGRQVMPQVTVQDIEEMIREGDIYGGMIPKVQAAMQCLQGEVQQVIIINGVEPNGLSRALQGEAVGTTILKG